MSKIGRVRCHRHLDHDVTIKRYEILYSMNTRYSHDDGELKHSVSILLSPDGRAGVWMLEGRIQNILLIHCFHYELLLPCYSGSFVIRRNPIRSVNITVAITTSTL